MARTASSTSAGAEEYWHGILDHHGVPGRRYEEVKAMGQIVQRLGDKLKGSAVRAQTAMLLSYDSRFAFQNQPHNPYLDYPAVFTELYRALWKLNAGVDIVSPAADLSAYRLVVAPMLYIVDDTLAAKLRNYVIKGGTLVLTCRTGVMDVDNMVVDQQLPGLLGELCGVVVDEYDSLEDGRTVPLQWADDLEEVAGGGTAWADVLSLRDAEALAYYAGEYYAGVPAVTRNRVGEGQVIYAGTVPDAVVAQSLMARLASEAGVTSPLEAEPGLEVVERIAEKARYLFILNGGSEATSVDVGSGGQELVQDETVSGVIHIPALGVRIIEQPLGNSAID